MNLAIVYASEIKRDKLYTIVNQQKNFVSKANIYAMLWHLYKLSSAYILLVTIKMR